MIEVQNLTKRFGDMTAVDGLTFRAEDGLVTGFLGPNGAGKTTTMRLMLGLDNPSTGWARIDGKPLAAHASPLRVVGALLNASSVAPSMTAKAHLRWFARAGAIPDTRVNEVLEQVGLSSVGTRRVGAMSLGMRQRLGIAAALLGDPGTFILDEPINGLDPEGVVWVRTLLKKLAREGRAVLVSSHLMSEMQLTADKVVVIGRGRLMAELSVSELQGGSQRTPIRVRAAQPERLLDALRRNFTDMRVEHPEPGNGQQPGPGSVLRVTGLIPEEVGDTAAANGIAIYELTPVRETLEDVFMRLTQQASEYVASDAKSGALL
ncbi:MAG: ATP-binding cassette domain-containing protein [Pseudonocardia sp.]|nr:ATP-binding cassette domain-containing protein [Pseudonocardia sp.]